MHTRRDFLRFAGLAGLAAGGFGPLSDSIRRAMAIAPDPGTTYLDAEHVVILMQENRSFDHCYGALRGVRGFNDPRAMRLPNGDPVWVQTDPQGRKFPPFRMSMNESDATWMGSLPHGWTDQTDAANGGRHDRWLEAKAAGSPEFKDMPLTMGFYSREDIPFYYELADAFTVCDQNFCSSLTGTTPNRLFLWSGTVRPSPARAGNACVRNEEVDYSREANWTTLPERLEDHGISWKIYQNELSVPSGLDGEANAWLSSFEDNPIEWFTQFQVRFARSRRAFVADRIRELPDRIAAFAGKTDEKSLVSIKNLARELESLKVEAARYTEASFAALTPRDRSLHERAFCDNSADPAYRSMSTHRYNDAGTEREIPVPAGDVLHQFRADVESGSLPAVSWLVAPERFSDHPSSAWFGAWYLSEAIAILTQNPEVWKKTIFILTYDENDGYFDHVPPFAPPAPGAGKVSDGIDPALDYHTLSEDLVRKPAAQARGGPIGLGFRVPMVIASPWSRGGRVCSQVFDHTSVVQFIERLFTHRTGKPLMESNISAWRRAVCGDLTSAFVPASDTEPTNLSFHQRDPFIEQIHKAKFKEHPRGFRPLLPDEVAEARDHWPSAGFMPTQEPGTRPSCPLPYELSVNAKPASDGGLILEFGAGNVRFGARSAGSPFMVIDRSTPSGHDVRHYAAAPGSKLTDRFEPVEGRLHLEVMGPNGFYREYQIRTSHSLVVTCTDAPSGELVLEIRNTTAAALDVLISSGARVESIEVGSGEAHQHRQSTEATMGWYDLLVQTAGLTRYTARFAGRVETGRMSQSDPAMA
jgi:phospholipase C